MNGAPAELLSQLRDIHPPSEVGWWPPAPGWWLLAATMLTAAAAAWWLHRRRRRRIITGQVLGELEALQRRCADHPELLLPQLSILLRRCAVTVFPEQQVAGLTGARWLEFLDRTGGDGDFSRQPGRRLADGPYAPDTVVSPDEADQLLRLARRWCRRVTQPDAQAGAAP